MTTSLFSHSACLYHETPLGHPESPDRLRAVLHALESEDFVYLDRREAPRASREQLARVHPPYFIDAILRQIPERGFHHFDADTVISPQSGEAALRAAGAVVAAVDAVMMGESRNAFCAVRPPGHHAEPTTAMGFCLFNNVAVGALHARAAWELERIAVVDFDVHHGNGTQEMFADDPDLFYASTHQWPLYPGTGSPKERGVRDNILNIPLRPFSGSEAFRDALRNQIRPALERFRPDFLLVSAGFDGHAADPLAQLQLVEEDYAWATRELMSLAQEFCSGRLVSTLEGGYNLDALAASAKAHVLALMGS